MSRRPRRSRSEQRTPTVIQAPEVALVQAADGSGIVAVEIDETAAPADPPRGGRIVELGAPFDEELPALPAEVLAAAGLIVEQAEQIEAERLRSRLPDWWPEDASQQAMLVEALDSWGLGYNEVGGIAFREQLVVVTIGGLKLHWPADRGRVISDMHKGRQHAHTGPGRQFPGGYLRRDASRDPKE